MQLTSTFQLIDSSGKKIVDWDFAVVYYHPMANQRDKRKKPVMFFLLPEEIATLDAVSRAQSLNRVQFFRKQIKEQAKILKVVSPTVVPLAVALLTAAIVRAG